MRPTEPRSSVLSGRLYQSRWSMGATLIANDPELAPVLYGTYLPTSEGWKAEFVQQHQDIGRPVGAMMVAQWFTHYATALVLKTKKLTMENKQLKHGNLKIYLKKNKN